MFQVSLGFILLLTMNVTVRMLCSPDGGTPGGPSKSLVIKNLSFQTTSESLQEAFEGAISAKVLMCPEDPSRSRGY